MNIYEIPKEVQKVMDEYMDCFDENGEMIVTEEVHEAKLKELTDMQDKKDDAIQWVLQTRANAKARQQSIGIELERLDKMGKREEKTVDKMENLLQMFVPKAEKPIPFGNWTISYRKSEQTIIDNQELIPSEFKKVKTTETVDKTAIKSAIKEGKEVTGAHIETINNLQIK